MSLKLEKIEKPEHSFVVQREVTFQVHDEDTGMWANIYSNLVFVDMRDPLCAIGTPAIPRTKVGEVARFLTALARTLEEHDAEIAAEFEGKKE